MPVIVTRNFGDLRKIPLSSKELMREIGLLAIEQIRRRTRAGESSDGGAFAPYSPEYAKWKSREVGGTGTVNLTLSGRMLNDLTITDLGEEFVEIGFKS